MKLHTNIKLTIGWCLSLSSKLFKNAPTATVAVQVATLASQSFLLLAFFLPIKVIILIGAEKIPHYFPESFQTVEFDQLIIILSTATALCYSMHLAFERVIAKCCSNGAKKILSKNSKLYLFHNQDTVAIQAYSRFTRAIASALFFTLSLATLTIFYKNLAIFICGYIVFTASLTILFYNSSQHIRNLLNANHSSAINLLGTIGFFLGFFYLVADFLYLSPPQNLNAIIAILILRQGLQRLTGMLQAIVALRLQYRKINALLYHAQPLIEEKTYSSDSLNQLLTPENRKNRLKEIFAQAGILGSDTLEESWHPLGIHDIYAFNVSLWVKDKKHDYLIKIFDARSSALAEQERLLLSLQNGLPTLEWLGNFKSAELDCHILKLDGRTNVTRQQIGLGLLSTAKQLLRLEPNPTLQLRFSRSHLCLEQRLCAKSTMGLRFACSTPEDKAKVELLEQSFPLILSRLEKLPRQIICLGTTSETILVSENQCFCISHWSNWRIEPLGSNWPICEITQLRDAVEHIRIARPAARDTSTQDVVLAALMFTYEYFVSRKNYAAALALLHDILECLPSSNSLQSPREVNT
ncbi:hypothetical protein [Pseudomonas fontis]|uniref:Uncharacterized protein n=1 Tax=Pseudomonas fontis TaxID=2942633 RepID=A0ABT5NUV1_9PSED|nr:hypothetical protein [Pseudomonas fontis]MDD0977171.1 hypothetical protein [Pseudomonas fontis]MDD0991946.1 hypothetical protein [Pseudomonas fontis]